MKILIADTADDTKKILGGILTNEGHECLFVEEINSFIDKVYDELPDLIILDIGFSRPNSIEVLKNLKPAPSTRDIPVILIASKRLKRRLAKGYELGACDYISKPYFKEEVIARISNITYAHKRIEELKKLLDRDYLTGLYNRKFFMERFFEEISWSARYKKPLSILMLDIDYFKNINDTYGHACGDEILKQVSAALSSVLREEDILARYGGEEFIILLPNINIDGAVIVAEKLMATVQNRGFFCNEKELNLPLTISIGVAANDGRRETTPDALIGQADNALYDAKKGGRNRFVIYRSADGVMSSHT